MVILGGMIAAAPMGDPNASIPTPQPVHYRPMFGSLGKAAGCSSVIFTSRARHWMTDWKKRWSLKSAGCRTQYAFRYFQGGPCG